MAPSSKTIVLAIALTTAGCWAAASDDARPSASTSAVASSASAAPPTAPKDTAKASLTFTKLGKVVKILTLDEIIEKIPPETIKQYDPYYSKEKTYRAVPFVRVLALAFEGTDLSREEYVLRAKDGYTVPMRSALAVEEGAYLAFEDTEVPGWEPIGQQKANPAPFYLVWSKKEQQNLDTHPRPYQLSVIEIAHFEDVFPHTAPAGAAEGDPARRGFVTFKEQCILCHAINREGGRIGPDLNVPKSVVEYRTPAEIKAYIKNPLELRYSQMPPHPDLDDRALDDLVAYFTAMKERKNDPDAVTHVQLTPSSVPAPLLQRKPPPPKRPTGGDPLGDRK